MICWTPWKKPTLGEHVVVAGVLVVGSRFVEVVGASEEIPSVVGSQVVGDSDVVFSGVSSI